MPFVIRHMFASFLEHRDFWGRCGVLGWLGERSWVGWKVWGPGLALSCQIEGEPMGIRRTPGSDQLPASWAVGFFHSSFRLV